MFPTVNLSYSNAAIIKIKRRGGNIDSKELVTVWILVLPKAPRFECVAQHGAGESMGPLRGGTSWKLTGNWGCAFGGELDSQLFLFFLFAIEVKLCLSKFSYHGVLHHLALKEVVLPSHGPEPPALSHNTLSFK